MFWVADDAVSLNTGNVFQLNTENWIWACAAMDEQRGLWSQGAALLVRMLLGFAVAEAGCYLTAPVAGQLKLYSLNPAPPQSHEAAGGTEPLIVHLQT